MADPRRLREILGFGYGAPSSAMSALEPFHAGVDPEYMPQDVVTESPWEGPREWVRGGLESLFGAMAPNERVASQAAEKVTNLSDWINPAQTGWDVGQEAGNTLQGGDPTMLAMSLIPGKAAEEVVPLVKQAQKKLKAYHATKNDFDKFGPAPEYRGSTYLALTPEGARKGSTGGAQDYPDVGDRRPQRLLEVELPDEGIQGLHWTPKEREWFDSMPDRIEGDEALNAAFQGQPNNGSISWDDIYEPRQIGDRLYEYVKKPAKQYSLDDVVKTNRDIYGGQLPGYQDRDVEAAKRLREAGMKGYLLNDEAGVSIAHIDPETLEIVPAVKAAQKLLRDPAKNPAIHKGKPFWSGVFDPVDGHIIETHPYERAEKADFHHSFYVSPKGQQRMRDETGQFFWVDPDGTIQTEWREAGAKPDIVGNIRSQLEFGPPATPDLVPAVKAAQKGIRAYHGTPHDFEKFDLSKIGTGEGAQAYGHGLYFAENEGVARDYRNNVKDMSAVQAINTRLSELAKIMQADERPGSYRKFKTAEGEAAAKEYDELMEKRSGVSNAPGHMYEVNINADPDAFLDWDKPLSAHPEEVRTKLFGGPTEVRQLENGRWAPFNSEGAIEGRQDGWPDRGTAEEVARTLRDTRVPNQSAGEYLKRAYSNPLFGGDVAKINEALPPDVSKALAKRGIPGIKYLDAGSRTPIQSDDLSRQAADLDRQIANAQKQIADMPESFRGDYQAHIDQLTQERRAVQRKLEPSRNYVVFSDEIIDIVKKYGIAGALSAGLITQQMADQLEAQQGGGQS